MSVTRRLGDSLMRIVFDTSALLKRYLPEAGRASLLAWVEKANPVVVAPHCKLELHSAVHRVARETGVSADALSTTLDAIERSFADMDVLPFTPSLERLALQALAAAPLRAMDALHVATALLGRADLFVTADRRQALAARAVGVPTEFLE